MTPPATTKAKEAVPAPRMQTDFQIVDVPSLFPSRCVLCEGTKGPLIDTRRQDQMGRIYVCARCVALSARVLGLIEGERHTELLDSGTKIGQLENDVATRDRTIAEQLDALAGYKNQLDATATLLEAEKGRAQAMQHQFQMIEQAALQGRTTGT